MRLLRPEALPDEYAQGYKGRCLRINGLRGKHAFAKLVALHRSSGRFGHGQIFSIELLAGLADMSVKEFGYAHTSLPLVRAVVSQGMGDVGAWSTSIRKLDASSRFDARAGASFCPKCVHEDVSFWGQSYWRRQHQIPGAFSCPKHESPLGHVSGEDAFDNAPSTYLKRASFPSEKWVNVINANPAIRRYMSICHDLLNRKVPMEAGTVSRKLCARMNDLGMPLWVVDLVSGTDKRRLIGDSIREQFDDTWLELVLNDQQGFEHGRFWQAIGAPSSWVLGCGCTTAIAIAFAALYESADEAAHAMVGPGLSAEPAQMHRPGHSLRSAGLSVRSLVT